MQSILKEIVLSNVIVNNKIFELYQRISFIYLIYGNQELTNKFINNFHPKQIGYFMRNASKEFQINIIKVFPFYIQFIKTPSEKMIALVIDHNPNSIGCIKNARFYRKK